MMRILISVALAATLAACGTAYQVPQAPTRIPTASPAAAPDAARPVSRAIADYRAVAPRIEREAETFCREENPGRPPLHCDFEFRLVDDPRLGANAFQTVRRDGRPVVAMTVQLLAETSNADEIAFVLSHEAGHHIAAHIEKSQAQAMTGALVLGALATLGNASEQTVADMMDLGAALGVRAYSQSYELEADVLGAFIAARAGYAPERGAVIFTRSALAGGGGLLSTHPPSPQRLATVQQVTAEIRRQQATGITPRPAAARR
jgi:Zn-dependent protease with chaperone function